MHEWHDNKKLMQAYEEAFIEGYSTPSFCTFIQTIEEKMRAAVTKELSPSKNALNDVMEQILDMAEDHYSETNHKHREG